MKPLRVTIGGAEYELVYKLPLLDLPQDLIMQILYRCDHIRLCRMATTCRTVRDLEAREHDALWSYKLLTYYGEFIFSGVIASSTHIEPLGLFKEMTHRHTVEKATLSSLVADRTVAQLNEMYDFVFEIHLYNAGPDSPVLQAAAVLVPPEDGENEEDFSLETVDGWATPEGWGHVAYDAMDGVEWVIVFAKHKATNTIARVAHIYIDEAGAGDNGDSFVSGSELHQSWNFVTHGGPTGDAVPDHGGVPFRMYVHVNYRDEVQTDWTKIKFSGFRVWIDDDDDDDYITPGQFELEVLRPRSRHLKWHPCKPSEC